jgi:hypothetical protein
VFLNGPTPTLPESGGLRSSPGLGATSSLFPSTERSTRMEADGAAHTWGHIGECAGMGSVGCELSTGFLRGGRNVNGNVHVNVHVNVNVHANANVHERRLGFSNTTRNPKRKPIRVWGGHIRAHDGGASCRCVDKVRMWCVERAAAVVVARVAVETP